MLETIPTEGLILAVGAVTYLLRAAPFLIAKPDRVGTDAWVSRLLVSASHAIVGGLISGVVLPVSLLTNPTSSVTWDAAARIVVITFTAWLALKTRRTVACLAAGMVLYAILRRVLA